MTQESEFSVKRLLLILASGVIVSCIFLFLLIDFQSNLSWNDYDSFDRVLMVLGYALSCGIIITLIVVKYGNTPITPYRESN